MRSCLNRYNGEMFDFVLFLFFRFTLVIKLRNVDFESPGNTLICSAKQCLIWLKFRCLSRALTVS